MMLSRKIDRPTSPSVLYFFNKLSVFVFLVNESGFSLLILFSFVKSKVKLLFQYFLFCSPRNIKCSL